MTACLVLGACGSSSDDDTAATTTGGRSATTEVPDAAPAPDRDATLRVATDLVQGTTEVPFDPARYNAKPFLFMNLIYDTLIHSTPDGLEPGLATSWTFPDASTIELELRDGVTFQDGTPFNADAVKFSWDRVIAAGEEMVKVAGIAALQSVEVVDDLTVRVHLSQPIAGDWRDRLLFASTSGIAIVSPTAVESEGDGFNEHPVGAGPYEFVEHRPGQSLRLRRWDGYWDPDAQQVAEIGFVHTLPGAPTVTALASGAVDLAAVAAGDAPALEAQGIEIEQFEPIFRNVWYQFCTSRAPFDQLAVRQAAVLAMDRDEYIETAYQGFAVPNDKFPAVGWPFHPEDVENPYSYDPDRARELLEEAGAVGAKVTLLIWPDPIDQAVAQVMQRQLDAVGFDVEIHQSQNAFADLPNVPWSIYFGWGPFPTTASGNFQPGGVANVCNYANDGVNSTFDETRDVTAADAQLTQAWADFQSAVYDDLPLFDLASPYDLIAHAPEVKGITGDIKNGDPAIFGGIYVEGS